MLPRRLGVRAAAAWVVAIVVGVVTVVVVDSGIHGDQSVRAVSHARLTGLANAARHRQSVWGMTQTLCGREAERVAQARLPTGVLHCHNRFHGQPSRNTLINNGIHVEVASADPHDHGKQLGISGYSSKRKSELE